MSLASWCAVIGGALGAFMAILDIQVTNASLRDISGALNLGLSESGWISSSYLIAEIIVIPLTAFLSQVFGLKRYMLLNCLIFLIASIMCGLSWNLPTMIFCRALQGLSGGTLIPLSFQIILTMMPEKQKPLGLTIFGLTVTLAPTLGPSLGGYLTDQYGWRSIFFVNIIPGLIMIMLLNFGLLTEKFDLEKLKKFDWISLFFLVIGLSGITYILEDGPKKDWFDSLDIRWGLIMAILGTPIFIVRQLYSKNPLLKLTLFRNRNFALGTIITAVAGCALFSGIYGLSLYLAQVQDYSAAEIGKVLMWVGLPQLLVMPFLPLLMRRVDMRLLAILGLLMFAYSNYINSLLNVNVSGEELKVSLWIRALGQPLFVIPLSAMAMALVSKTEAGEGSSIFNMMRNLGASLGIALTTTFIIKRQTIHMFQMTERLSAFDNRLVEKMYMTEMQLRGAGLDAATARIQSAKEIIQPVLRDSLIESFSDIFFVLTWALLGCCVLVLMLKKTEANNDISASH
ncbi:MAG: DHA2 family efflux MFS transporter permease subunit [Bdellovibrionaceae bacterium]|nr:DHA2 family efflux MFS transporter permease subunit [Pseudobdellovibrionaceae bacterium]